MQHAGSSLEWEPASHGKDRLMGTKKKKVNFEVIMCWMPFLTCSCRGHSAHMVKVDGIFKVTEIYKVTLAGHPAWFFFFFSLVYRNNREQDHTIYWLQKGNAVVMHEKVLKDQNWTRRAQWSRENDWDGGRVGQKEKEGRNYYPSSHLPSAVSPSDSIHSSSSPSEEDCCMPSEVRSSSNGSESSLWPSEYSLAQ